MANVVPTQGGGVSQSGQKKSISSKHQHIQHIRQVNNSQIENYQEEVESQGQASQGPNSPGGQSKFLIKNRLGAIAANESDNNNDCNEDREASNQRSTHHQGFSRRHNEDGGMTLEDDVESMLSENHLNQSNSSMFRVRPGMFGGQQELGNGDSTFRGQEDSILGGIENDRGDMISESEDGGWY